MAERPTFSPVWHRVRAMKPRLRPHVQITRQHYRGRRWHVVHDPTSNHFYRLNPVAHGFVALLDGKRTVEEVWKATLTAHGDHAPTQQEVVELIGQLHNSNLLSADASPETEQLLRRGRDRVKRHAAQQAIGIMYFRMRLFNPDRILGWIEPILRPLLNRWGFLLWLAWVVAAVVALIPHADELARSAGNVMDPANWGWMIAIFIVTKAIHETGHGVICKRFGGQVPEFGVMLLVLFPSPYVDVSSTWTFASKWRRISVGAGGMIFELAVAAGAAWVWLNTPSGDLLHRIAYNALFTASVSTVIFNANPLMRFDGYYILSDLLEVPNLMQRSMKMLQHLCQRFIYRLKEAKPPTTIPAEAAILIVYGLLTLAYRVFLFFSITLYIMGKLFALGLVLALWTAAAWFLLPLGKFIHWMASSPQLSEHRARAIVTSLALLAGGVVLLGVVRFPDRRRAEGVVESPQRSGVFFGADGRVVRAEARPGGAVRRGDPILVCESPDLEGARRYYAAELARVEAVERDAMKQGQSGAAEIAREKIALTREQLAYIDEQIDRLTVRAPHDGVIVGADPADLVGSMGQRGQPVCEVVDTSRIHVAASLSTAKAAPLFERVRVPLGTPRRADDRAYTVEIRRLADPQKVLPGGPVRLVEAGNRLLPHAALGHAGGGQIEVDPQERSGRISASNTFVAYIEPADEDEGGQGDAAAPRTGGASSGGWTGLPGERVVVRFSLERKPLLHQWIDRLHKLIQGRADI